MKINFKVKTKVTIEFLVEIYFRNDLHLGCRPQSVFYWPSQLLRSLRP